MSLCGFVEMKRETLLALTTTRYKAPTAERNGPNANDVSRRGSTGEFELSVIDKHTHVCTHAVGTTDNWINARTAGALSLAACSLQLATPERAQPVASSVTIKPQPNESVFQAAEMSGEKRLPLTTENVEGVKQLPSPLGKHFPPG